MKNTMHTITQEEYQRIVDAKTSNPKGFGVNQEIAHEPEARFGEVSLYLRFDDDGVHHMVELNGDEVYEGSDIAKSLEMYNLAISMNRIGEFLTVMGMEIAGHHANATKFGCKCTVFTLRNREGETIEVPYFSSTDFVPEFMDLESVIRPLLQEIHTIKHCQGTQDFCDASCYADFHEMDRQKQDEVSRQFHRIEALKDQLTSLLYGSDTYLENLLYDFNT